MIRNSTKLTAMAVATLLGGLATVNCSKNSTGEDKNVGHVNLALNLASGAKVNSVHYVIKAGTPLGITDVSGDINTSDPNATASAYQSFPASMGDTVKLTATTTAGESCTGTSTPFTVTAGGVAMVDVVLVCGGGSVVAPNTGSVSINGTIVEGDDCPVLTAWSASPLQTSLTGTIDVAGLATDADVGVISGETLTYAWTGGTFANPAAASTQFTCTVAGDRTLTLTVSDNHVPTPCSTSISIPVKCIGGVVCHNGVVEMGEACDAPAGTAVPGGICGPNCQFLPPVCNNSVVELGESCDPPNGTTCSATCQTIVVVTPVCGNGIIEAGETCEPNNTATCDANCHTISAPVPTACELCGLAATNVAGTCFQTSSTANAGTTDFTKFGCNGFTGADKTNCQALIGCMRTNDCGNGNDPTPCLCGNLTAGACATTPPASLPGVCKNQYIAAAAGGDVFGLFFSTDSPIGISNNLYTCDIDAPCTCP